jgi:putative hydrolase of the HAD superfamily
MDRVDRNLYPMPPLLVFDLMDTVVVDPFYREAMTYLGTTLADLGKVKHPTSWIEFETGITDEGSFLERFYRAETALALVAAQLSQVVLSFAKLCI